MKTPVFIYAIVCTVIILGGCKATAHRIDFHGEELVRREVIGTRKIVRNVNIDIMEEPSANNPVVTCQVKEEMALCDRVRGHFEKIGTVRFARCEYSAFTELGKPAGVFISIISLGFMPAIYLPLEYMDHKWMAKDYLDRSPGTYTHTDETQGESTITVYTEEIRRPFTQLGTVEKSRETLPSRRAQLIARVAGTDLAIQSRTDASGIGRISVRRLLTRHMLTAAGPARTRLVITARRKKQEDSDSVWLSPAEVEAIVNGSPDS